MHAALLLVLSILSPTLLTASQDLDHLLDIYNPDRVTKLITSNASSPGLSTECHQQMRYFGQGLADGKLWALQMSDASGRYSGSFLWGNSFWLGSSDLCAETRQINDSIIGPAFSVAKVSIELDNKNVTPHGRIIYVGMCLPSQCELNDVRNLLQLSSDSAELGRRNRNFTILSVRSPDLDDYVYYQDPTFIILTLVATLVCLLCIGGSACDIWMQRQTKGPDFETQCQHCCTTKQSIGLDVISVPRKSSSVKVILECNGNHAVDSYTTQGQTFDDKLCDANKVQDESGRLDCIRAVLLCFSVPQNARAIFDRSVGGDTLSTLHGLRFLSMVWVILGHSCIVAFKYADNTSFRGVVEKEFMFQTISNAAFSVDTFFFISGLLFSFLYFRTAAKVDLNVITRATGLTSKFLQMIGLLAYRFGRLTAPYMFVLGVVQVSMKWFHHKSVFEPPTLDHENCPKFWWRNALYINTLFPVKDMCMLWSWYLADDTQFYVLGSILVIIAVSHFRTAAGMFVTFMVSSWCTTAYIAYTNNHQPSVDDPLALFDKIYDKPWTRLGPYLVGMGTGWLLYNMNCKLKLNKAGVAMGWSVCTATMLSLLYGLYDAKLDALSSAAYSSLSHSAWALGTAWIVVACSTGHGGVVSRILSAPALYPMSRVTYCAYLVHPLVIRMMVMYVDSPLHLGRTTVTLLFMGHTVISYLLAFVVSLAFEAPVVALLRLISPKKDRSLLEGAKAWYNEYSSYHGLYAEFREL